MKNSLLAKVLNRDTQAIMVSMSVEGAPFTNAVPMQLNKDEQWVDIWPRLIDLMEDYSHVDFVSAKIISEKNEYFAEDHPQPFDISVLLYHKGEDTKERVTVRLTTEGLYQINPADPTQVYVIDPQQTDLEPFQIENLKDVRFMEIAEEQGKIYSLDNFSSLLNGTHTEEFDTNYITRFL